MSKRLFLTFIMLVALTVGVVGMSAYEAHIINVTAKIENALTVDPTSLDFGTIFPQESFEDMINLSLSDSFSNQDRVNTVQYVLRQKPKCWSESEQSFGTVTENDNNEFVCKDEGDYDILPLLCPYLSKHEISSDGELENDSAGISAFHGPLNNWSMFETNEFEQYGMLANRVDSSDEWLIDLKAPCFEGHCAQDWPAYVLESNPDADPFAYIQPADLESSVYGCDLWFEVIGIDGRSIKPLPVFCTDNDLDTFSIEGDLCGLLDCDDDTADIYPGAGEVCDDGIDNDCNENVDCDDIACASDQACIVKHEIEEGDIIITEIMQDPSGEDSNAEWFEIYNTTDIDINLDGCMILDSGADDHTINGSLPVSAGSYIVLGKNTNTSLNGNLNIEYAYGNQYFLANTDDEVILSCDGVEIDRVEYDGGPNWPDPTGASISLAHPSLDNNDPTNWCVSTSVFGDGDKGTPGFANDQCMKSINFSVIAPFEQYGYDGHAYIGAAFDYAMAGDGVINGIISGIGLKPYVTYQLKFEGVPTCKDPVNGDDVANEAMGYRGRWWNDTDGVNTSDGGYESDSVYKGGTDCIIGYLVWDHVTADADGTISKTVYTDDSLHVLWCNGGTCGGNNNSALYNLDGLTVPPGYPYCDPSDVGTQLERAFGCNGMTFDPGKYSNKMIITEESFHQSDFGDWTGVMQADIEFTIY